ncbi:MAG: thioredoxin-related protein [Planctomycetota bacterium]|jgi:thioredoxin-related protein
MPRSLTCALLGLVLLTANVRADGVRWFADFDEAAMEAKAQGKDLLVDFTGSDWCGWCIKLHKEVFDHEEWIRGASADYVFVALDFPRGTAAKRRVPNAARNLELQQLYDVTGFPAVLLMSADGDRFGQLGYKAGGPANYLRLMRQQRRQGRAKLERALGLAEALQTTQGDAREAALVALLVQIQRSRPSVPGFWHLIAGARSALGEDYSADQRARSLAVLFEKGELDSELFELATLLDPKGLLGLREYAVRVLVEEVTDKPGARAAMGPIAAFHALGVHVNANRASHVLALGAFWAKTIMKDEALAKTYARSGLAIGNSNPKIAGLMRDILGG